MLLGIGARGRANSVGGYLPHEGPSAGFLLLGMYFAKTLQGGDTKIAWIRRKDALVGLLWLHPFRQASMTP